MSEKVWIATFRDRGPRAIEHTIGVFDTKELAVSAIKGRAKEQCDFLKKITGDDYLAVCDLGAQGIVDYRINVVVAFGKPFGVRPVTFYEVREETIQKD